MQGTITVLYDPLHRLVAAPFPTAAALMVGTITG